MTKKWKGGAVTTALVVVLAAAPSGGETAEGGGPSQGLQSEYQRRITGASWDALVDLWVASYRDRHLTGQARMTLDALFASRGLRLHQWMDTATSRYEVDDVAIAIVFDPDLTSEARLELEERRGALALEMEESQSSGLEAWNAVRKAAEWVAWAPSPPILEKGKGGEMEWEVPKKRTWKEVQPTLVWLARNDALLRRLFEGMAADAGAMDVSLRLVRMHAGMLAGSPNSMSGPGFKAVPSTRTGRGHDPVSVAHFWKAAEQIGRTGLLQISDEDTFRLFGLDEFGGAGPAKFVEGEVDYGRTMAALRTQFSGDEKGADAYYEREILPRLRLAKVLRGSKTEVRGDMEMLLGYGQSEWQVRDLSRWSNRAVAAAPLTEGLWPREDGDPLKSKMRLAVEFHCHGVRHVEGEEPEFPYSYLRTMWTRGITTADGEERIFGANPPLSLSSAQSWSWSVLARWKVSIGGSGAWQISYWKQGRQQAGATLRTGWDEGPVKDVYVYTLMGDDQQEGSLGTEGGGLSEGEVRRLQKADVLMLRLPYRYIHKDDYETSTKVGGVEWKWPREGAKMVNGENEWHVSLTGSASAIQAALDICQREPETKE